MADTVSRGVAISAGRIVMDEDLERIAFVASLGTIPPLESVSVFISTSSELQTLPSGAVRVLLPAVCVPRVPQPSSESTSTLPGHQLRTYEARGWDWGAGGEREATPQSRRAADVQSLGTQHACPALTGARLTRRAKPCCGSGSPEQGSSFCLAQLLESEATNPSGYEFSFHLEIRGPCLLAGRACCGALVASGQCLPSSSPSWRGVLWSSPTAPRFPRAGVESPTHKIRADADPSARSARSIVITLADKHTFDRPVEILIHPSGRWALLSLRCRSPFLEPCPVALVSGPGALREIIPDPLGAAPVSLQLGVSVFLAKLTFGSSGSAFPEPHMPHVLMEEGDMTPAEYERHLKGKNDFIKGTKKDPSAEKKVRGTSCRASARAFLGTGAAQENACFACLHHASPITAASSLGEGLVWRKRGKFCVASDKPSVEEALRWLLCV